ncbi:MAG TPA: glycosyl hydrolase, partial [Chloroflexota bacterium]|nr:glycosyl hydrolase [Chloroflexota bacterium]
MRIASRSTLIVAVALLLGLSAALIPLKTAAQQEGPAFAVANQAFWDYYQKRGGVRSLGYPISRQFTLRGYQVQLFQRGVLQLMPDGSVSSMNLLGEELLPYSSFNGSLVPSPQRQLMDSAPSPADPDYAGKAVAFVQAYAPDQWEGLPVNFGRTFMSTVRYEDAFPAGDGNPTLLPLLNLEMWGLPTSEPARDPNNGNFVYQRFQRGIMQFDATTGTTQGLLLGDYLKAIMTGQGLPADIAARAVSNPLYGQYDAANHRGPLHPELLSATNLDGAFQPGWGDPRCGVVVAGPCTNDPNYVARSLASLGAGSWYDFSNGSAWPDTGRAEVVRPGAKLSALADRARANPGTAWLVGNEPNVPGQDDLKPSEYADFLYRVAAAIKGADPTAILVGPNSLNWEDTCTSCPGFTKGRSWSEEFVTNYRQRYGALPLDVWGIHAYSLDWENLPLTHATAVEAQIAGAGEW